MLIPAEAFLSLALIFGVVGTAILKASVLFEFNINNLIKFELGASVFAMLSAFIFSRVVKASEYQLIPFWHVGALFVTVTLSGIAGGTALLYLKRNSK